MPQWKRYLALSLVIVLIVLTVGCGQKSKKEEELFSIIETLALTDKNDHTLFYGMPFTTLNKTFETSESLYGWRLAHENLSMRFTSHLEYEDPTIALLVVEATAERTSPSWTMENGIGIGTSFADVQRTFLLPETEEVEIIDLLFLEDTENLGKMYCLTPEEEMDLTQEQIAYRATFHFEQGKVIKIILGDLASMA